MRIETSKLDITLHSKPVEVKCRVTNSQNLNNLESTQFAILTILQKTRNMSVHKINLIN